MCVTDCNDMTLAVKVVLNPNTTNPINIVAKVDSGEKGMNPVSMTINNPLTEYCLSPGSNRELLFSSTACYQPSYKGSSKVNGKKNRQTKQNYHYKSVHILTGFGSNVSLSMRA